MCRRHPGALLFWAWLVRKGRTHARTAWHACADRSCSGAASDRGRLGHSRDHRAAAQPVAAGHADSSALQAAAAAARSEVFGAYHAAWDIIERQLCVRSQQHLLWHNYM